ncbi:prenyltransferase [Psychroflexus sp. YR1-1]|uniref:Prenyltransferase n=1 Tax=Psychroflexus aurantiacus TaxID=2709310 RepID=A0A6B3R2Y5_9FLAO|nr:prenyltransferase [Psychroflexus aurantiacus]NEV95029.1 prenyltransferase [Psychroflexus aurantiacus]
MNFISKFLKLYINSSIHVALAVVSFACLTYLDFGLEIKSSVLVFVFFSTLVAYTFVKYIPLVKQKEVRLSDSLKFILFLSVVSVLPIFISLFYFDLEVIGFIVLLGVLTLLYVLPFLPEAKNLRDVSGLKIFIIASVWTGATVVLPFLSSEVELSSLDTEQIIYIMGRFLIVIALIIPFEIRDLELDDIYLKTLPQVFGVLQTKVFGIVLIITSMFLMSLIIHDTYIFVYMHLFILLLVVLSKRHNAFLYTVLLVEAVPILWFLLKYFTA